MRTKGIDTFRFIAIIFVITIHVFPCNSICGQVLNQIARFAVPYFFIVAGYFFYKKTETNNSLKYFFYYGTRLLYVYLFWYAVYAFWPLYSPENWINIFQNGFLHEFNIWKAEFIKDSKGHFFYFVAAGGRGFHLWFLPSLGMGIFLLAISIRFKCLYLRLIVSVLFFSLALLSTPYRDSCIGIPFPFATQYGPFFSSIFVFIGAIIDKHNIRLSARFSLSIAFIGLMVHMVEIYLINATHGILLSSHNFVLGTLAYGTGVTLFAIAEDNFGAQYNIHLLGELVLGIFVSHIFLMKVLDTFGIWPSNGILRIVLLLIVSILFTRMIFRIPMLRRVVC